MSRVRRSSVAGWSALVVLFALGDVNAEGPSMGSLQEDPRLSATQAGVPVTSIDQLIRMNTLQLDRLYQASSAGAVPPGKVRGHVIYSPGSRLSVPASKVARLMWQGKIFNSQDSSATNKFFGVRIIRGKVYYGESWLDGRPSLILDYAETSRLYAPYRDEIREVAPGVFLGLMYERTFPQPKLKMYFALECVQ